MPRNVAAYADMQGSLQGRARILIDKAGMDALVREGTIGYSRWQSVRYKDIRMSSEEIEVIARIFPMYALWLVTGKSTPVCVQTSPELAASTELDG